MSSAPIERFRSHNLRPSSDEVNIHPKLPSEPTTRNFRYDDKQLFERPDEAKLKDDKTLNEVGKFLEQPRVGCRWSRLSQI